MAWYDFLKDAPEEAPEVVEPAPFVPPTLEKVEKNIDRFRRALEQNTKGDERKAQLRRNLQHWEKIKELIVNTPE